jgi:site-specific recombinase XerD
MRTAGDGPHGQRLRALTVVMWRAGLRIQEALALSEGDLDRRRGSLLVRRCHPAATYACSASGLMTSEDRGL